MTFSSGAVQGPCFFFVHARVPFKRGNLRKGTPSHRSQDLYLWGWWAGGSNHGTPSMKTAWLIMGTLWVVQSTQWWHLVTHVSVLIDLNPWTSEQLAVFLGGGLYFDLVGINSIWFNEDFNESQAGCTGIPKGFSHSSDMYMKRASACRCLF